MQLHHHLRWCVSRSRAVSTTTTLSVELSTNVQRRVDQHLGWIRCPLWNVHYQVDSFLKSRMLLVTRNQTIVKWIHARAAKKMPWFVIPNCIPPRRKLNKETSNKQGSTLPVHMYLSLFTTSSIRAQNWYHNQSEMSEVSFDFSFTVFHFFYFCNY